MKKIVSIIVLLILFTNLNANPIKYYRDLKLTDKMYVNSVEGLKVKDNPTLSANTISKLINSSEINIIEIGSESTIDGITDYWVKIVLPKLSWSKQPDYGWVFGGYLENKVSNNVIIRYDSYEFNKIINNYSILIKRNNNKYQLIIKNQEKTIFTKEINGYFLNSTESKLYFYHRENYVDGLMIWEQNNPYYSISELDLETFNIVEIIQSKTVEGGHGIRVSENGRYLAYPEEGGEMVLGGPSKYYFSFGTGAIYDLVENKTIFKRDHTVFYPIKNSNFIGISSNSYYYLYDLNFNLIDEKGISMTDENFIPSLDTIYDNSFSFFFTKAEKIGNSPIPNNWKITVSNKIEIEEITNCFYENFIKIKDKKYCIMLVNNKIKLYDNSFILINNINYPQIPNNLAISTVEYENGIFVLYVSIAPK